MAKAINQNDLVDIINSATKDAVAVVDMVNKLSTKISKIKPLSKDNVKIFKSTSNNIVASLNCIKPILDIEMDRKKIRSMKLYKSAIEEYMGILQLYNSYSEIMLLNSINFTKLTKSSIDAIQHFIKVFAEIDKVKMRGVFILKMQIIKFRLRSIFRLIRDLNNDGSEAAGLIKGILNGGTIKLYLDIISNVAMIFDQISNVKLKWFFGFKLKRIKKRLKKLNKFILTLPIPSLAILMKMVIFKMVYKVMHSFIQNMVDVFNLINNANIPKFMWLRLWRFKRATRKIIRFIKFANRKTRRLDLASTLKSIISIKIGQMLISTVADTIMKLKQIRLMDIIKGSIKLKFIRGTGIIKSFSKVFSRYIRLANILRFISIKDLIINRIKAVLLISSIRNLFNVVKSVKVGLFILVKLLIIKASLKMLADVIKIITRMKVSIKLLSKIKKILNVINRLSSIFVKLSKMIPTVIIGLISLRILNVAISALMKIITIIKKLTKVAKKFNLKTLKNLTKIITILNKIKKIMKKVAKLAVLASLATIGLTAIVIFLALLTTSLLLIKVILGLTSKAKIIFSIGKLILIMIVLGVLVAVVTVVGLLSIKGSVGAAALIVFSVLMCAAVLAILLLGFVGNFAWSAIPGLIAVIIVTAIIGVIIWGFIELIKKFAELDLTNLVENVNKLMESMDVIVNSLFTKNENISSINENNEEPGWFSKIINSDFAQGLIKIAKIALSIPALLCTLVVIGLLGLIANSLNTINNIKIGGVEEQAKAVILTSSNIANMILNDENGIISSLKTVDDKTIKKFKNYNEVLGIVANLSQMKWGAIDENVVRNNKELTTNYINFVEKINTMDLVKLQTSVKLFEKMADFSKSINGNFEKLAESINEELMPVLEELRETLNKIPEKIDTNAASVSQSIGAYSSPLSGPSTTTGMEAQVNRENPGMSKEEVKREVDNRLNEQARAQASSLESKFDELIELLKSGMARVSLT